MCWKPLKESVGHCLVMCSLWDVCWMEMPTLELDIYHLRVEVLHMWSYVVIS